jgi:asparagine synthase (glutamine-hydrolysing)
VSGDVALLHGRDASNYSFGQKYDTGLGELLQFQLWDIAEYLPNDILAKTDRMGMAHGLEIRAPFLDHHLAAWMLNRPEYLKIDRLGNLKVMLRYATSQIYGDRVARRPKQGFSIPIHQWIRKYMKEYVSDLLSSTSLSRMGIFDNKALGSFVDMHMKGKRSYGFEIWGILVLAAWHRTRVLESSIPKSFLALDKKEFALM